MSLRVADQFVCVLWNNNSAAAKVKKKWKVPLPNGRDVAVTDIINETLFDVGDDELEENWQLSPQPSDVLVITREYGGGGLIFVPPLLGFLLISSDCSLILTADICCSIWP